MTANRSKLVVAFTGHRPDKLGGYGPSAIQDWVRRRIHAALHQLRPAKAISGMALGVDQWAAEICIELKIPFIAAVPFEGQDSIWPKSSQVHYRELLGASSQVVNVSTPGYSVHKLQVRNEWMVDHCDVLIAVWDGSSGGTSNCVRYARRKMKRIIRIDPKEAL